MNDIHNNENISQEEEFVSPGQEKVNGKATPEQSGPSTGEPREQPGEPTEEAVEIEETEEIEIIEAGEFTVPKKEEEEEESNPEDTKYAYHEHMALASRQFRKKRKFRNFIRSIRGGMYR